MSKGISREQLIEAATSLFKSKGVKSVTLDRICSELHTSKRTIYQHFRDKNELLKACLDTYHQGIKQDNEKVMEGCTNAIEAFANLHHRILARAAVVNSNFFNDILHFYPGMLQASYRDTGNFAHVQAAQLAEWAIKDGLFHPEMDVELSVATVLSLLELLKDNERFPVGKYSKERLTFGILLPYMRGLCTAKGLRVAARHEESFRVAI